MNINTVIMISIFLILVTTTFLIQGKEEVFNGFKHGVSTFKNVWVLLIIAFGIAGFLEVLVPPELISQYLGHESGWKGIFIGWALYYSSRSSFSSKSWFRDSPGNDYGTFF